MIVGDSREIRMIGYIKGTVLFVGGGDGREVVVEAGQSGVGYRILMALSEVSSLEVGAQAELHVYTQVREDAIELYGFRTADERTLFTRLVTVNGVGAKLALSILDTLTPGELQNAVLTGDTATLKRVSGIGPKVAARVILELESFLRTHARTWSGGCVEIESPRYAFGFGESRICRGGDRSSDRRIGCVGRADGCAGRNRMVLEASRIGR